MKYYFKAKSPISQINKTDYIFERITLTTNLVLIQIDKLGKAAHKQTDEKIEN